MDYRTELQPLGSLPPLGVVPKKMYAWTLRRERLGDVSSAYQQEIVPVPELRPGELLVANKYAGVNYNGVWAAEGNPKNVVDSNGDYGDEKEDFHICGSESSGIVYAAASDVTEFKVGDDVCVGGAQFDRNCPFIRSGGDPCFSPSYRIWGYEGNWGAFAQFSRVQVNQCKKRPQYLSWEESAAFTATGVTVYRMLFHWKENRVKKDDVVLIWGGYGGIGMAAIPLVRSVGAVPIVVVSDDEKGKKCVAFGAAGYINRNNFNHWGSISQMDERAYRKWIVQAVKFKKKIWEIVGRKKDPDIVIEHPGADTFPTSLFVCAAGGMVTLCGATTGYIADMDLRFLWLTQKRVQGCHAGNEKDYEEYLRIMEKSHIHPRVSNVYEWSELPKAHADLADGKMVGGKFVVKIV